MAFMHILKRDAFFGASVGSLGASVKWENVATDDENGAGFDVKCCVRPSCAPQQMQRWIDQAKNKLLDIIAQAKEDVANISLRVAFVG